MGINVKIDWPIKIDLQQLYEVEEFTYLESKEGGASEDIRLRLQKAGTFSIIESSVEI